LSFANPYDFRYDDMHSRLNEVNELGLVDITHVSAAFLGTTALFLMLVFSFLSLAIVQLFSLNKKRALLFFLISIVAAVIYFVLLNVWLKNTM
jgi:Na+/glutamate symporter